MASGKQRLKRGHDQDDDDGDYDLYESSKTESCVSLVTSSLAIAMPLQHRLQVRFLNPPRPEGRKDCESE